MPTPLKTVQKTHQIPSENKHVICCHVHQKWNGILRCKSLYWKKKKAKSMHIHSCYLLSPPSHHKSYLSCCCWIGQLDSFWPKKSTPPVYTRLVSFINEVHCCWEKIIVTDGIGSEVYSYESFVPKGRADQRRFSHQRPIKSSNFSQHHPQLHHTFYL